MPGAASGAPELRTLPAKGAPSQLRQSPSKRNGTLAPLACELWPPYRCPNPHRVCALNTGVGVLRGFLPRGLCDTGPQVVRDHRLGASSGQVSHNPKQQKPTRRSDFAPVRGEPYGRTTVSEEEAAVQNGWRSKTGLGGCCCSGTDLRVTQISLLQSLRHVGPARTSRSSRKKERSKLALFFV